MKQNTLNIENTIYHRDANEQVMAIYESIHLDQNNSSADPSVTPCIDIVFNQNLQTVVCPYEYKICGGYTYDVETGEITLNQDVTSEPIISGPCYGTFHTLVNGTKIKIDTRQLFGPSSTMSLLAINDNVESGTVSTSFTIVNPSSMPKLSEWHIYGNEQQGRFVTRKPENEPLYYLANLTNDVINKNYFRIMDKKQYELKDHLGNVRVAIGDMKIPTGTRGVAPFVVDEKAVNDYYPYGMLISDRSWSSGSSRYGFGGHEMDNETKGTGNQLSFGDYGYDPRTVRRGNIEPYIKKFPSLSSYVTFNNNPILFKDPDGKFSVFTHWWISTKSIIKSIGYWAIPSAPFVVGASLFYGLYHTICDLVFFANENLHLDNKSNSEMRELMRMNGYSNFGEHQLQDFYCHTNYFEILIDLGIPPDQFVNYESLPPEYRVYVLSKIQSTNNNTLWNKNKSNNVTDHSITDEGRDLLKIIDPDKNIGNTSVFYSKHSPHPLNLDAKNVALDAASSQKNGNNKFNQVSKREIIDTPLSPGVIGDEYNPKNEKK